MAKVLGESAEYVTEQAIRRYEKQVIILLLVSCVFSIDVGYFVGHGLTKQPSPLITFLISMLGIPTIVLLVHLILKKLERTRLNFRKGATGEALVGYILAGFPDAYRIIPGVETTFGDIDHVVVGPTGVYAIDTKNWRGIVTADDEGELLLNGRPTKKPAIRNLTRSIMTAKKKIKVRLALDPYVRGVLAFPSARVEAKWGTTGSVHCITDEQLYDYIVEKKKRLTKKEIDVISQAFLVVARKDKDFPPAGRYEG